MEIIGLIVGVLGLIGTIIFGVKSKNTEEAFGRYIELQKEVERLQLNDAESSQKIDELLSERDSIYRHHYKAKSTAFVPGDRVKLSQIPRSRSWITRNSKIGMHGIVVDYGPGNYEYLVYWSESDYKGEPTDNSGFNTHQSFYVNKEEITRLT
ncbi:hypothetical protein ABRZ87_21490 [Vibrio vulnificus]|uniref:hypothetical protein n=1 Tax=Vibrio vulnificus TaxID=672 RepID=UPI0012F9C301|nr:hypothetical protein [Vibrio vulnificus]MCJ0819754.1 hypothetical protein [Vibrio vulnificus]MVT24547.1 hypothetical protein [Vibrio vulnificus]HAS6092656.1 hypothetical protein [Vibrio vulnificus]HDY7951969.1 hypothetical protein [Vibrio vulnificus]